MWRMCHGLYHEIYVLHATQKGEPCSKFFRQWRDKMERCMSTLVVLLR